MYKKNNVDNNTNMRKKVLLSTFLIILSFIFINTYKAKTNICNNYQHYNNVSTFNIQNKLSKEAIKDIFKICSNNVCTFNIYNDLNNLLRSHQENVLEKIKDEDKKIVYQLKGIKIDTIYFKNCI